jgi:phosphatidylglycerol---prolipoprotein diacylglyceryl transferase
VKSDVSNVLLGLMKEWVLLASAFFAAGYGTGIAAFFWLAKRRGMATAGIFWVALTGLVGGLLGAVIGQYLMTGQAGKSVLGAILGGWIAVWICKKVIGIRRPTGDLFAVAICAGESVGRWGCFFGGCCYGKPTEVAWSVFQHDAHRHPTQIYLSLASLLVLGVLLFWEARKPQENLLFVIQGALYCSARFVIEFFRDAPTVLMGLSAAQWVCLLAVLYFSVRWVTMVRRERKRLDETLPKLQTGTA